MCFVFIGISYGRGGGVDRVFGLTLGREVGVGLGKMRFHNGASSVQRSAPEHERFYLSSVRNVKTIVF